jgi:hypothetical protein
MPTKQPARSLGRPHRTRARYNPTVSSPKEPLDSSHVLTKQRNTNPKRCAQKKKKQTCSHFKYLHITHQKPPKRPIGESISFCSSSSCLLKRSGAVPIQKALYHLTFKYPGRITEYERQVKKRTPLARCTSFLLLWVFCFLSDVIRQEKGCAQAGFAFSCV